MASRLRIAATNQEEFLQAAATQVMFFEAAAMFGSIETRLEYQQKKATREEELSTAMTVGTALMSRNSGTLRHPLPRNSDIPGRYRWSG